MRDLIRMVLVVCLMLSLTTDQHIRRVKMAIKVFIKRKCPKEREKELFCSIREIRSRVPQQPGYISGEYLKSIDDTNEITTISSWFSLEDWQAWFESEERLRIQSTIDAIPGVTTEYSIYRYIKTR
jgi:heme-degrading monooxygenase HmoA